MSFAVKRPTNSSEQTGPVEIRGHGMQNPKEVFDSVHTKPASRQAGLIRKTRKTANFKIRRKFIGKLKKTKRQFKVMHKTILR